MPDSSFTDPSPSLDKHGASPSAICAALSDSPALQVDRRVSPLIPQAERDQIDNWTSQKLADFLGVALITIESWRSRGVGPPFVRLGGGRGRIRYRKESVVEWLQTREQRWANRKAQPAQTEPVSDQPAPSKRTPLRRPVTAGA